MAYARFCDTARSAGAPGRPWRARRSTCMSKTGSAPVAPLTRKQASRVERERRQRLYILIGAAVVALAVVGVILAGVIDLNVLRPRQPVARVESVNISKRDFVKAAKFQRYQLVQQYV